MSDGAARSSRPSVILPFLSPVEWQVFSILSRKGPLTARQLVAELATTENSQSDSTLQALARRLADKGYLRPHESAASNSPASAVTYCATVSYAEGLRRHAERFLAQYALGGQEDLHLVAELVSEHLP